MDHVLLILETQKWVDMPPQKIYRVNHSRVSIPWIKLLGSKNQESILNNSLDDSYITQSSNSL